MITAEELVNYKYIPSETKTGILWFSDNGKFFLKLNSNNEFDFYFTSHDTIPVTTVHSMKELIRAELAYYEEGKRLLLKSLEEINKTINNYKLHLL
ncbi:MAG: hypothetical protein MJ224_01355 [archaeon]|nr:hypothetical protein [archaeon]